MTESQKRTAVGGALVLLLLFIVSFSWVRCDQACMAEAKRSYFGMFTLECWCLDQDHRVYKPRREK